MIYGNLTSEQQQKAIAKFKQEEVYKAMTYHMLEKDIEEKFNVIFPFDIFDYDYKFEYYFDLSFIFLGNINADNIDNFPFADLVYDKENIGINFCRLNNSSFYGVIECNEDNKTLISVVEKWYRSICKDMEEFIKMELNMFSEDWFVNSFLIANEFEFDEEGNWL